jgi:hypothetical protein
VFQQHFEFFCFEMMCQYVIGRQKTLIFCRDLTEGALFDNYVGVGISQVTGIVFLVVLSGSDVVNR